MVEWYWSGKQLGWKMRGQMEMEWEVKATVHVQEEEWTVDGFLGARSKSRRTSGASVCFFARMCWKNIIYWDSRFWSVPFVVDGACFEDVVLSMTISIIIIFGVVLKDREWWWLKTECMFVLQQGWKPRNDVTKNSTSARVTVINSWLVWVFPW